ncbi:MAG: hypothetical protein WC997_14285 [Porticoccaceae bacterium]
MAIGAAAIAVTLGGVYLHGESRFRAGQSAQAAAQNLAELKAFRDESTRLAGLSVDLQGRIDVLAQTRPKIIERYTHETTIAPLPDGCVIDPGRLQHINSAVSAANAAAEFVGPLPARSVRGR